MPKTTMRIVQEVIGKFTGVSPDNVKSEDMIGTGRDIDVDSLDQVEMIMAIEDEFNIKIPDAEVRKITTVQDILDIIRTKQPTSP